MARRSIAALLLALALLSSLPAGSVRANPSEGCYIVVLVPNEVWYSELAGIDNNRYLQYSDTTGQATAMVYSLDGATWVPVGALFADPMSTALSAAPDPSAPVKIVNEGTLDVELYYCVYDPPPTPEPTSTDEPTSTATATNTPEPVTATSTATSTATATSTPIPSATGVPPTVTPFITSSPSPGVTNTPVEFVTVTPSPTVAPTVAPTVTTDALLTEIRDVQTKNYNWAIFTGAVLVVLGALSFVRFR